jgi:murein DD-endopeptidase MepM/ murein hydrolase activator NlpD
MSTIERDLALHEHWDKSLERSRRRRELAARARKEVARRKGASAAMATAMLAGPTVPFAAAASGGGSNRSDGSAVPANAESGKQIEIRAGGLPLSYGYEGDLVAALQRGVGVQVDGIYGPLTESAVKAFQRRAGLPVTGVVDPATWNALFSSSPAQGQASSSAPGPVADLETAQAVDRAVPSTHAVPAAAKEAAQPKLRTAESRPAAPKPKAKSAAKPRPHADVRSEPRHERRAAPKRRSAAPKRVKTKPVVDRGGSPPVSGACGSRLVKPVKGIQTSGFGMRWGRMHEGVDLSAPTGTAIRAAACGVISFKGQQSGYGNIICIKHSSRFETCYAHMSRFAGVSGRVRAGQVIGYVGCTGSCTGPHLHFETRVGGSARNPVPYLRGARIARQPTSRRFSAHRAPVRRPTTRIASSRSAYSASTGSRWNGGTGSTSATAATGSSGWQQQAPAQQAPQTQATVTPAQPAPQPAAPVQQGSTVTRQVAPQPAAPAPAPTPVTPEPSTPQPTPAPAEEPKPAATTPAPTPVAKPEAPAQPQPEAPQAEAPAAESPAAEAPKAEAPQTQAPEPAQTEQPKAQEAPADQAPSAPKAAEPASPATPAAPASSGAGATEPAAPAAPAAPAGDGSK